MTEPNPDDRAGRPQGHAETDLLDAVLAAQLGRPLYDAINKHLADGQQTEGRLRVAEATARHWHRAALDRNDIPMAHAIACIGAALGGETDPGQLGWPEPAPDTAATQATDPQEQS